MLGTLTIGDLAKVTGVAAKMIRSSTRRSAYCRLGGGRQRAIDGRATVNVLKGAS